MIFHLFGTYNEPLRDIDHFNDFSHVKLIIVMDTHFTFFIYYSDNEKI